MGRDYWLTGTIPEYLDKSRTDLLARWQPVAEWLDARLANGVDPYNKANAGRIGPFGTVVLRDGSSRAGINMASQDYLNLSAHPIVIEAARQAALDFGVHSAGSAALSGNSALTERLEHELAAFLKKADCTVFPTGWGAGFGAIRSLVTKGDHIVIDSLAHACLREGAEASGATLHTFPHLSNAAVERRLKSIRERDARAGILVVTESLFSMDADCPDLRQLSVLCQAYEATLLVDAAHDLGAMGEAGLGNMAAQGVLEAVDVIVGSFSKTFASNGGFVAARSSALKLGLRLATGPLTFTNALSPIQISVVLASLGIVQSSEGSERRKRLAQNVDALRTAMQRNDFEVMGSPSPIVPVLIGDQALSRLTTRQVFELGGLVNLVEYPAVSRASSRWRLQVMATHDLSQMHEFAEVAAEAKSLALNGMLPTGAHAR